MIKIFYDGYSTNFSHPADRRRFIGFARRFPELIIFTNYNDADYIYLTLNSDLSFFISSKKKIIFDYTDHYLVENGFKKYLRSIYFFLIKKYKFLVLSHKNLIRGIIKKSEVIICASNEQYNDLKKINKNSFVVYDYLEKEVKNNTNISNHNKFKNKFNVFWEGQSNNIDNFLGFIKILNGENFNNKNFLLHIVTDDKIRFLKLFNLSTKIYLKFKIRKFKFVFYKWSKDNLKYVSRFCHIGVITNKNKKKDFFFSKKSPNKLRLMLMLKLPTLCINNLSYKELLNNLELGCLYANNEKDFLYKLNKIYEYPELLDTYKKKIEKNYYLISPDSEIDKQWLKIFKN